MHRKEVSMGSYAQKGIGMDSYAYASYMHRKEVSMTSYTALYGKEVGTGS